MKSTHRFTKIVLIALIAIAAFVIISDNFFPQILDKYYGILFVLIMGGLIALSIDCYLYVFSKPVMKGNHRFTKIALIALFVFLFLEYIFFTDMMDKYDGILFVIITGGLILALSIDYYLDVFSKPVMSSKAKVMSKRINDRHRYGYVTFYATFLFVDKTTYELEMTEKQYKSINVNDIVNLEYQGYIVNSVEKIHKHNKVNLKTKN